MRADPLDENLTRMRRAVSRKADRTPVTNLMDLEASTAHAAQSAPHPDSFWGRVLQRFGLRVRAVSVRD